MGAYNEKAVRGWKDFQEANLRKQRQHEPDFENMKDVTPKPQSSAAVKLIADLNKKN